MIKLSLKMNRQVTPSPPSFNPEPAATAGTRLILPPSVTLESAVSKASAALTMAVAFPPSPLAPD
jgi:hypothetical protein